MHSLPIQFLPVGDHRQFDCQVARSMNTVKSVRAGDESELPTRGSIYNTLPGKVVAQNGRETINKATEGIIIKRVIKHWY